jgi:hypothetical protein
MKDKIVIITGANSGIGKAASLKFAAEVTGQLINHELEIVKPATTEKGFTQLKNIFGSSSYPRYAINPQNIEQIWKLSTTLTED